MCYNTQVFATISMPDRLDEQLGTFVNHYPGTFEAGKMEVIRRLPSRQRDEEIARVRRDFMERRRHLGIGHDGDMENFMGAEIESWFDQ